MFWFTPSQRNELSGLKETLQLFFSVFCSCVSDFFCNSWLLFCKVLHY